MHTGIPEKVVISEKISRYTDKDQLEFENFYIPFGGWLSYAFNGIRKVCKLYYGFSDITYQISQFFFQEGKHLPMIS